jgi:hypothetical protein
MSGMKSSHSVDEKKDFSGPMRCPAPLGAYTDPLEQALGIITASRETKRIVDADGFVSVQSGAFNASTVAAMRSFLGPKTYKVRLSKVSSLTSGTATIAINVATDLTVFNEGAALAALFDECRLHSTTWRLVPQTVSAPTTFPFVLAYEPVVTSVTPTAVALIRLPHSKLCTYTYNGSVAMTDSYRVTYRNQGRPWGLTSAEGSSSTVLVKGLDGTFRIANVTGGSLPQTSVVLFAYSVVTIGEFRSRA